MSMADLKNLLTAPQATALSNKRRDVFHVTLQEGNKDAEKRAMTDIASLGSSIVFVSMQEPGEEAVAPSIQAFYNRLLLGRKSSSNTDGIYYKPEGAEYSIYYADTYLYITPDIFTGAMTGIFFVFTGLIGYSCLNAIQGNDIYASKPCLVGKEN